MTKKKKDWQEPEKRPTSEEWVKMITDWVESNKPNWMKYTIKILENQEKIVTYKNKFWISVSFYTKVYAKEVNHKIQIGASDIITQIDIELTLHPYNVYGDVVCYKINRAMQTLIKAKEKADIEEIKTLKKHVEVSQIILKKTFTFESFIEDFYEKLIKDKTGLDVTCGITLFDLNCATPISIWVDENLDEEIKEKLWEIGFHEQEIE